MQHPNLTDRDRAILWARNIVDHPDRYVVFDCETSGLDEDAVIIEMAVTDFSGNIILDTKIRPTQLRVIPSDATNIHGITMNDLLDAPTFKRMRKKLEKVFRKKKVIAYNWEFTSRILYQTILQDDTFLIKYSPEDVIYRYAEFIGDWMDSKKDYAFHRLPHSQHHAASDCQAIIKVIHEMAQAKLAFPGSYRKRSPWWKFW